MDEALAKNIRASWFFTIWANGQVQAANGAFYMLIEHGSNIDISKVRARVFGDNYDATAHSSKV